MNKLEIRILNLKWTISKARNTYGYNVLTLTDISSKKRYKTWGGGYDMHGAALGEYIQETFQQELREMFDVSRERDTCYGIFIRKNKVLIDGYCGFETVADIAKLINIHVSKVTNKQGHVISYVLRNLSEIK
jgi:hypothetical protein